MNRSFAAPVILALLLWHGLSAEPSAPAEAPVRLTILGDNSVARPAVKAVWGFSCLVQTHGHTILFDTGADPAVLRDNLAALRIDPAKIEAVVVSHSHDDHTRGAPGLGLFAQSDAEVLKVATAMRSLGLANVSASHCTGPTASAVFRRVFGTHYIDSWVGATIDLPLPAGTP